MSTGSKVTSKIAGAGKGAAKALQGYPGIFHHLATEHGEVSAMITRVANSSDVSTRNELFPEIRKNLLAHAHGEEQEFYPRLAEFSELDSLVKQSLDEHQELEQFLQRLDVSDKSGREWGETFEQFKQAVENHVQHEEKDLFPKANDLLDGQQARKMEESYERAEEREKARL